MTLKITTDNIATTTVAALGGVKITSLTYPNSATAADPAGSETITVNGSGFNTGAKVYIDTTLCTTTYVSSTSLTFVSPAKSIASYHLFVYNTDGSNGMMPIGMVYSSIPVWVTSAGALATGPINSSYSQTISATGDGTITYSITSGSLPSGLSLNSSTGAITGTCPGTSSTSTFTITASDSQNQKASRSFSISIVSVLTSVEYLVVAGGGAGSHNTSGGGGAGGFLTSTGYSITLGTPITVTIGGGGAYGDNATSGENSVFGSITATGGGAGRGAVSTPNMNGLSGGSGGGGGYGSTANGGAASPSGQGNPGGGGIGGIAPYTSGGGGGAGGAGSNASGSSGGDGGVGLSSSITGTAIYYAGGGGGGGYTGNATAGAGGNGGGANAQNTMSVAGNNGTPNTGGGGGGAGAGGGRLGGNGGSGIVVIRYANAYADATSTTGLAAGYPQNTGGYKIYKWITSGTITF